MNANKIVYLVGEPGIGKSYAFNVLTRPWKRIVVGGAKDATGIGGPFREWIMDGGTSPRAVELGRRAGKHPEGYPGTDAMSMSAIGGVDYWLTSGEAAAETDLIIGEGARLGVRRFVDIAVQAGWDLTVVYAHGYKTARAQREARGSQQSDRWVRGAKTRAANFAAYASCHARAVEVNLDAGDSLVQTLREETGLEL